MNKKVNIKKILIEIIIAVTVLTGIFIGINNYEYNTYVKNYNNKINSIILKINEKYNDITEYEIAEILNSGDNKNYILDKYGISLNDDSVVIENDNYHNKFKIIYVAYILICVGIVILLFKLRDNKKNNEIKHIIKLLEAINRKDYLIDMDELSESEFSILNNEIYKTVVMLKESAEQSLNDKKELKKSLEDISHQLKTPLTSILIMLDNIIDNDNMDEETKLEFIKDIKEEVKSINFLIQNLLKLSKFDVNAIKYNREKNLLIDIINKAVANVNILCDLKNININITGLKTIIIKCDQRWEVEALTNIIKNCVEHSNNDSKIDITLNTNTVYTSVIIRDYGAGILKEDIKNIFKRFNTSNNALSDSIGIGLALSKSIIEKDLGNISVESNQDGTTFTIKYYHD